MAYQDLTNAQIGQIAQYICDNAGELRDDVFPPTYQAVHIAFAKEIVLRTQSINDNVHIGSLSRAKQIIRDHWTEIPPEVQQLLIALRDNIIALRGDIA